MSDDDKEEELQIRSVALQNAQSILEARQRADEELQGAQEALREESRILELLNDTGTAIAAELDLQSLAQKVTDSATRLSGAQAGAFFYKVINDEGEAFLPYALSGAPREAFERFGLPHNADFTDPTFRGLGIVRSGDITQDERYRPMPAPGEPPDFATRQTPQPLHGRRLLLLDHFDVELAVAFQEEDALGRLVAARRVPVVRGLEQIGARRKPHLWLPLRPMDEGA